MPSMARGLTSAGGIIGVNPASRAWSIAMLTSASSRSRADAGQVVEARAGHLRAAVDVDGAEHLAELDVVAGLEALGREVAGLADVLEHDEVVLAAGRRLVGGRVRDRHQRVAVGRLGLGLRRPRPS